MTPDQNSHAAAAATNLSAGHTRTVLSSIGEFREHLTGLVRTAERRLTIYCANLSSHLYEQPALIDSLKRMVLMHRYTQVRILVGELPESPPENALLAVARHLPTCIQVRIVGDVPNDDLGDAEFTVADERAVLYRLHNDRWDGMVDRGDVCVARFYLAKFDALWSNAIPLIPDMLPLSAEVDD